MVIKTCQTFFLNILKQLHQKRCKTCDFRLKTARYENSTFSKMRSTVIILMNSPRTWIKFSFHWKSKVCFPTITTETDLNYQRYSSKTVPFRMSIFWKCKQYNLPSKSESEKSFFVCRNVHQLSLIMPRVFFNDQADVNDVANIWVDFVR